MSATNFKRPVSIDPQERRDERQIKVMAMQIQDQAMLDKLLDGTVPIMREAMLERLLPHLPFFPKEEVTADCAFCGMRRGSVIPNECRTAAEATRDSDMPR
jgi:hypothetical protein